MPGQQPTSLRQSGLSTPKGDPSLLFPTCSYSAGLLPPSLLDYFPGPPFFSAEGFWGESSSYIGPQIPGLILDASRAECISA
jgi:hypothetical protein